MKRFSKKEKKQAVTGGRAMNLSAPSRRELLMGAGASIGVARPAWSGDLSPAGAMALEQEFGAPPDPYKPWVYWWWLNGNVTEKSITRDLEEMRKKGIGGFLMFDSRAYGVANLPPPPPRSEFMSDEWRRLLKFAMREAARLGLKMSANLSTSGGTLRSPWPSGEDAPKKLVWTSAEVRGLRRVACDLRRPDKTHFWDVAVLGLRRSGIEAAPAGDIDLSGEWRDSMAEPKDVRVAGGDIVDLTARVDAAGRLTWDAPEGHWTLLRFACVATDGSQGDVDILNANAAERHFERMGGRFLADAGPLAGKTLTHFYNVSWEGATPTWTPGFEKEFLRYRGYDLRSYLPVLAGMTVENPEITARFLEDYSRTLADCFLNHCYKKIGELCHRAGVKWHSESGGPWNRRRPLFTHADQMAFYGANDMPQGEFWHPRATQTNCRRTAMAAHIYGLPVAAAEAFTNMVQHWSDYPAVLKPRGDDAFIDGVNHFIWHTFDASPEEFGKPGIVYFAGSHLNPNVTWWEHAGAFVAYLARCQFLLRQGQFVSDVCVYTSDRNYAGFGRDERWPNASLELDKGHTYDLLNTEVLLQRVSVRDGSLVLPDGMRYRILAVDLGETDVPPEALRKLIALAEGGATLVLGRRRPERAPGLRDAKARDAEVRSLAARLWGEAENQPSSRPFAKGKVVCGTSLDEALRAEGILPDFVGPWQYNHRRAGDMDIYFVAGEGRADCVFRVGGKEPELWDPITGRTRATVHYRPTNDGRTLVPISLPENGSVFVVFRRPTADRHLVSVSPAEGLEIERRTQQGARLRLWRPGKYVVETSARSQAVLEAAGLPGALVLEGPWEVRFAPGGEAPESVAFDRLIPWNEHPDEGIRYFSGTAVYRKRFQLHANQAKRPARLQLGQVKNIARVRLNGKPLGVVWTAPWSVEVTGAVKPGRNELEVEVTNLWVNRLIGDAGRPEKQRRTKTIVRRDPGYKGRNPHLRGYLVTDPLQPSGLLGPVELEFGEVRDVRL